jgi:hypothetical protein
VLRRGRADPLVDVHGGWWRRLFLAGAPLSISSSSGVGQIPADPLLWISSLAIKVMVQKIGVERLGGGLYNEEIWLLQSFGAHPRRSFIGISPI